MITIVISLLFLIAEILAIMSLTMPDWIITDTGDTNLGLMWSCMTLYKRPQICFESKLKTEWMTVLECIFMGCILITATITLLIISHWVRAIIPAVQWVGFGAI